MKKNRIFVWLLIFSWPPFVLVARGQDAVKAGEVLKSYSEGKAYPRLLVRYPRDGTIFPPEIAAPIFRWDKGDPKADAWVVFFPCQGEKSPRVFMSDKPEWKPRDDDWESLKNSARENWTTITLLGVNSAEKDKILEKGSIKILTSKDPVGDSILYRDVNLPFSEAVKDPSKIAWRYGSVASSAQPPIVLTNLPVCGNCHSVSRDGKMLGLDVDYANDKGAYAITGVSENIVISRDKIISWNDYKKDEKEKTFGLLSQVSPDGRYFISTVKDRSVFIPRDDLAFSQLFFPFKGILAFYDRTKGVFKALPGADDKKYVQSNPTWSPDGKTVVFARSEAVQLKNLHDPDAVLITQADYEEFNKENPRFLYDLYRIAFNGGNGGVAQPIRGASEKDYSEFFAKFSPDGKWIVFCRAKSYMLLQPDSELFIIKAEGGTPRRMNCNTPRMNSWHSFSSNGRWLVFASKGFTPYTQLFLTHIDENGMDSPAVVLEHFTAPDRAANIPEFVNLKPEAIRSIKERFLNDQNFMRAAVEFRNASDYQNAEDKYRKAMELNPGNLEARHDLGIVLLMQNRPEEAIAQFNEVLGKDPGFLKAYDNLAVVYKQQRKYDEALLNCQKALAIDPKDEDALNTMAIVYSIQGKLDEGLEIFKRIIQVNPRNMPAYFNIAAVYREQKKWDEALRCYFEADRIAPNTVSIANAIGVVYADMGKYQEAYAYFMKALEIDPNSEEAKLNLESVKAHVKK